MRKTILIIIGFVFLIFWLIVGYPLEISNLKTDRILEIVAALIIIAAIFVVYKLIKGVKNKAIKISLLIPFGIISVIYIWIGLWTYMISNDKGPKWEDMQVYTNQKGTKVISQFRETSGSIYDYRERLIFHDFSDNDRISIEWTKERMHGSWKVKDIKKDSTYIENFD